LFTRYKIVVNFLLNITPLFRLFKGGVELVHRIIEIGFCYECPFYGFAQDSSFKGYCSKEKRYISRGKDEDIWEGTLPDWCSLEILDRALIRLLQKEHENKLKTSEEWSEEFNVAIINPGGWSKQHFENKWNEEKISKKEFIRRCLGSTLQFENTSSGST